MRRGSRREVFGIKRSFQRSYLAHRFIDLAGACIHFEQIRRQANFNIRINEVQRRAQAVNLYVRRQQLP